MKTSTAYPFLEIYLGDELPPLCSHLYKKILQKIMFWSKSDSLQVHLIMIVYDGPPLVFDWKGSPEFVPAQISFYLSRKAAAIKAIKKAGS